MISNSIPSIKVIITNDGTTECLNVNLDNINPTWKSLQFAVDWINLFMNSEDWWIYDIYGISDELKSKIIHEDSNSVFRLISLIYKIGEIPVLLGIDLYKEKYEYISSSLYGVLEDISNGYLGMYDSIEHWALNYFQTIMLLDQYIIDKIDLKGYATECINDGELFAYEKDGHVFVYRDVLHD